MSPPREARRVRHDLRFRRTQVVSVQDLTPRLRRIVLGGDDLEGFASPGFDDHVKIFPAADGDALVLPTVGPDGPIFPTPRPVARDYTPRAYDAATRRLTINFVVGHGGPATRWAQRAGPGSVLGVGGPRGSFLTPVDYADHVLMGDETALPAIARRLEELPHGVRAWVAVETPDDAGHIPLHSRADLTLIWAPPGGLAPAAAAIAADPADAYVWIAGEAAMAKAMRGVMIARGFDPRAMKAAAYWRRGAVGAHQVIED